MNNEKKNHLPWLMILLFLSSGIDDFSFGTTWTAGFHFSFILRYSNDTAAAAPVNDISLSIFPGRLNKSEPAHDPFAFFSSSCKIFGEKTEKQNDDMHKINNIESKTSRNHVYDHPKKTENKEYFIQIIQSIAPVKERRKPITKSIPHIYICLISPSNSVRRRDPSDSSEDCHTVVHTAVRTAAECLYRHTLGFPWCSLQVTAEAR